MEKFNSITGYLIWLFAALLAFLIVFESSIVVPQIVLPLGRLHPLILHFPIVLVIMLAVLISLKDHDNYRDLIRSGIMITALVTILTSIMGLLLSLEEAGNSQLITNHKRFALIFTALVTGLTIPDSRKYQKILVYGSIPLLILAAHFGGSLTHGRNYVLAPLEMKKSDLEIQPVFEAMVLPILDRKCMSCHNPDKRKGSLDLSSLAAIREGGESGPLWEAGGDSSILVERIKLPVSHEDHMPPEGRPQLDREEIQLLITWISAGADFSIIYSDLESKDPLFSAVNSLNALKAAQGNRYAFDAVSDSEIEALNTSYRSVSRLFMNSDALEVAFFVRSAFTLGNLNDLLKVSEQLVSLDLSYMPIRDVDLDIISRFPNLERLNLNYTDVEGAGIGKLASLKNLRSLSFAGSGIKSLALDGFNQEHLDVYVWDTPLSRFESEVENINIHYGYEIGDEPPIQLSAPIMSSERILEPDESIILENSFQGTEIRFTMDGTDPDSTSTLYSEPINFQQQTEIKARSYKKSWIASETATFTVFKAGLKPDSIVLLTFTEKVRQALTAEALIDKKKGDLTDFGDRDWLAYRRQPFESWMDLGEEEVERILLTYGVQMGSYIMPPASAEIWGSTDGVDFELIERKIFDMPEGYGPNYEGIIEFTIPRPFRYYKMKAEPLQHLPSWHAGAGDAGWIFLDELFVY